jgi:hypothetical protein
MAMPGSVFSATNLVSVQTCHPPGARPTPAKSKPLACLRASGPHAFEQHGGQPLRPIGLGLGVMGTPEQQRAGHRVQKQIA